MFAARWKLFRLLGIPIYVDLSWLLILILLTSHLTAFYREKVPDLTASLYYLMGLGSALFFFACIVLHEMGHALVAQASGIRIRGITLFLFGGVAEMEEEPKSAGGEFLMAIGGPVVSLVLGLGLLAGWVVGTVLGWPAAVLVPLLRLGEINLAVMIFNLVPAFPLDGGRVLRAILWGLLGSLRRATRVASWCGQGFAWLLIGGGLLSFLLGNVLDAIWLGLIGLFLMNAARGSYQQLLLRQALSGEPVRRFMNPEPIMVPPWLDLRRWIEDYVYRYHRKAFPVGTEGHLEGYIATEMLSAIPRDEWDRHVIEEVMNRDLEAISIAPDADALEALQRMQRSGVSRLMVVEGDRLVGIVSLKDLFRFLNLKLELEGVEDDRRQPPKQEPREPRPYELSPFE